MSLLPAPQRHDLLFGYFGDCDGCVAETADHVNLVMVMGWGTEDAYLRHATEAIGAGKKIMLAVCWKCGEAGMRWDFDRLQAAGVLSSVVALYPQDEPDVAGMTTAQVAAMAEIVRRVASGYPELDKVALAVIYGPHGSDGMEYFDWVGRDNYGAPPIVPILNPGQRALLIPGGADPWRADPKPWLDVANRTPAVVAIIPFLWRWPDGHPGGIATNGMSSDYRAAGVATTR